MKKLLKRTSILGAAVISSAMIASTAFGAVICSDMEVIKTGSKVIGGSQVNVIRVMRAGSTCGSMGQSDARTFNFAAANGDAGLATALTALSLGRNVYLVLTANDAANGTTVETIQVSSE